MNERDIQNRLALHCFRRQHIMSVPNVEAPFEHDLLSLTKARLSHEFEIKLSKADFKADFKKERKHDFYSAAYQNDKMSYRNTPNYFWYVCPEDLITLDQVPAYAGLMWLSVHEGHFNSDFGKSSLRLREIKKAPRIHSEKMNENRVFALYRSIYFRFWKLRSNGYKWQQ